MNNHRILVLAFLLLVCTVLPGCMTASAHREISKRQEFVDDFPQFHSGKYLGELVFEGEPYQHLFVEAFPWPMSDDNPTMHLYIPQDPTKEVHVFKAKKDIANISWQKRDFFLKRSSIFLAPEKSPPMNYSVIVLITKGGSVEDAKKLYAQKKGAVSKGSLLILFNKEGTGTRVIAAQSKQVTANAGTYNYTKYESSWRQEPYFIRSKPHTRKWYSPADNLIYLVTVPLDILTSPFQAIYFAVGNLMMSGMSPK